MLLQGVLLMMLGAVWAQQEPAKCCFEKQYTATMGEVGARVVDGVITAETGVVEVAYDFYRKRSGMRSIVTMNGVTTTMYTLRDYANKLIYNRPAIGTCTYHTMPDFMQMYPPCIPQNATYLGPGNFGYGSETLGIHEWELDRGNFTMKLAVTEDCVPVYDVFYDIHHGRPREMTFFFTAYKPGIEDMESLVTPDPCSMIEDPHHHHNGTHVTGNRPVGRRAVRPM